MSSPPVVPAIVARIALVGFMGAGKSTVGPLLAERLGWAFTDVDQQIQQRSGSTVAELFSNGGEASFRRFEAEVIADLHGRSELVLALGGGALETESTRTMLIASPGTYMIFLDAPFATLLERCDGQVGAAERPLLQERTHLKHRFDRRREHYQAAHLTVNTEGLTPSGVCLEIIERLQQSVSSGSPSEILI